MTCEEFERVLPEIEEIPSHEQESHLASCFACADLVADLNNISRAAKSLRESEEPSPRVWNSIEIALRQEGLIRNESVTPRLARPFLLPGQPRRRRWSAWWAPVAVALLLVAALLQHDRSAKIHEKETGMAAVSSAPVSEVPVLDAASQTDAVFLAQVSRRSPQLLTAYRANLQDVNSYIRDAEETAKSSPNDEQAQQDLMNAYQEKSMVYELALDRSSE